MRTPRRTCIPSALLKSVRTSRRVLIRSPVRMGSWMTLLMSRHSCFGLIGRRAILLTLSLGVPCLVSLISRRNGRIMIRHCASTRTWLGNLLRGIKSILLVTFGTNTLIRPPRVSCLTRDRRLRSYSGLLINATLWVIGYSLLRHLVRSLRNTLTILMMMNFVRGLRRT